MLKNDRSESSAESRKLSSPRRTWRIAALLAMAACGLTPFSGCAGRDQGTEGANVQALVGEGLVISQVFGGGGSDADDLYNQDFVELFNRSNAPVPLDGLSIQYANVVGRFNTPYELPSGKSVPPGGYFLIGFKRASGGTALPTPDNPTPFNTDISSLRGKIALARVTTALNCGEVVDAGPGVDGGINTCPREKIVDLLGYGAASDYETVPTSEITAKTAAIRGDHGCTDVDNNSTDFTTGAPNPRNSSVVSPCAIDAGPLDANLPDADIDAGPAPDAEPPIDAGGPDAEPPVDAGTDAEPVDAGTDAEPPVDAGDAGRPPLGTGLVLSQVYGGGGNTGAPFNRDFVELFNRSDGPVSLSGLSLQYASAINDYGKPASDGGTSTTLYALPDVTLERGKYFLVGMAVGSNTGAPQLPALDGEGAITLGANAAKIALARTVGSLNCGSSGKACDSKDIVDKVGFGAPDAGVTDFEGSSAAPGASNTLSVQRKGNGCTDTDNNNADFTSGAPAPRNRATAALDCSTGPSDAGTDAGKDAGPRPDSGTPGPVDSGTGGRFDGGSNGATDSDSGCSCRASGTDAPGDKALAVTMFGALGLVISARRRRRAS